VKYLPMGIWASERVSKAEGRAFLGLDQESTILIFMGNLDRIKGPDILIRAVAELQNKIKSLIVLICGQGPEESNLTRMISDLDLHQVIRLVGSIPPDYVNCWLSAADLCIIPSRRESFGLVALEAMACGTPVIAAQVGGLGENIIHGQNGFLFPKEDHLKLAQQIELALQDKFLRKAITLNGLQTAAEFDMFSQAEKVRQVYIELTSPQH
jgi:D-inositol-3-phosphate glycosyltransferase